MKWSLSIAVTALVIGALAATWTARGKSEQENHAVVEAMRRVLHVATIEMQISDYQLRRDAKDLWGFIPISCEKTVAAFYRGKVAAGFKLSDQEWALAVKVDASRKRIRIDLPPPQILYTEVGPPELVVMDGSLCNAIEPSDYQRLHADVVRAVERAAVGRGIFARAEANARQLFEEIVRPFGFALELSIGPTRTPEAIPSR